jgi:hypothetical protein
MCLVFEAYRINALIPLLYRLQNWDTSLFVSVTATKLRFDDGKTWKLCILGITFKLRNTVSSLFM